MTPITLIQRKFRRRWSDLQLLVLLELGVLPQTYPQLVKTCKASNSGIWNVITGMVSAGLLERRITEGYARYYLTVEGMKAVAELLK